ncbi:Uncharacterised protein [Segatella copri]|nr:Uncharacterised protein [Segatella copri]
MLFCEPSCTCSTPSSAIILISKAVLTVLWLEIIASMDGMSLMPNWAWLFVGSHASNATII